MIEFGDETANEADRYDIAGDSDDTEDDDMPWGQKDDDDDENSVHDRSGADDPYPLSSSPGFDRRDDVHQDQEWRSHQVASRQQLAQFDRVEDISSPFYDRGGSGALEPVTPQRGGYNSDGISISATTPSRARASSTTSSITQVLLRSHVNLTFGVRSDASIASSYGMSSTDGTRGGLRSKVLRRLGSQAKQAVENIKSTSMAEYIVELRGPSSIDAAHRSLVDEGDIIVYRLPKVSGDSKSPKLGPLCDDGDVVFHRPLSEMLDAGLKDLGRRDTVTFRYVAKQYVHELAYHKTGSVAGEARKPGGDLLTKSVSMLDGHHSSDGGSGSLEGSLKDLRASDSAVLPPALREIESQDPLTTSTATTVAPAAPGRTSSTTAPKDKKDGSNLLYRRLKLYLPPQPCFGSIGLSLHFATILHSKKKTMNKKQPTHELHQDPLSMSAADKKPQVTDGDRNSVKYNYLDIRFDNSSTRDKWWDILRSMLGTQLLQHVREGSEDEAEIRRVEAQAVIDDMVGHRPAVEKFVEYFRSDLEDPADVQTDGAVAVRNTSDPPDGGVLEVVFGPLHRKPRKLSIGKMQTRGPDGEQILRDGTGTSEPHLVIGPCNLRQRLRMVPSHAFPLRTLTVCAQDDQWGNTFYLERRDEASVKHSLLNVHSRKILVERAAPVTTTKLLKLPSDALGSTTVVSSPRGTPSPGSFVQSPTTRLPSMGPPGRDDPLTDAEFPNSLDEHASSLTPPQVHEAPSQHLLAPITSATPAREEDHGPYLRIELSTRSFVQRLKWMQWFTRILGKPVVYVHDSTRDTSGPLQDTDDAGAVEAGGAVTLVEGEDGTITRIVHRRPMFSWLYAKPAAPAPLTTSVIQRSSSLLQNRSFPPLHSSKSMSTSPSTTTARVSGRSSPTTSPTDDRDAKNNHHEALVEGGESIAAAALIPPAAVLVVESDALPSLKNDAIVTLSEPAAATTATPAEVSAAANTTLTPRRRNSTVLIPTLIHAQDPVNVNVDAKPLSAVTNNSLSTEPLPQAATTSTVTSDAAWQSVERRMRAATVTEGEAPRIRRHKAARGDTVGSKRKPPSLVEPEQHTTTEASRIDDSIEGAQLVVGCDLVWVRKPPAETDSLIAQWSPCRLCVLQTPHSTLSPLDAYDSVDLRREFDAFGCTVGFDACLAADWITRTRVVMKSVMIVEEQRQQGKTSPPPPLSSSSVERYQSSHDWSSLLDAIAATDDYDDITSENIGLSPSTAAVVRELPVLELYFDAHPVSHARALDWYMQVKHHENEAHRSLSRADDGDEEGVGSILSDGGSWLRVAMMEACAFHRPLELSVLAPTSASSSSSSSWAPGDTDASLQWALDVARAVLPFLPEATVLDDSEQYQSSF